MNHEFGNKVVINLGGSVIFPDKIDWRLLKDFRSLIKKQIKRGRKFVIVTGGGKIGRVYQKTALNITKVSDEDKDWLGIYATRSNANLLRVIFREVVDPTIMDMRHKLKRLRYPVTIASGWQPGWSTDYVTVAIAEDFKIPEVIIASDLKYVYNKDPRKFKNAKPLREVRWDVYRALIPKKWVPGANLPVDPIAARLAHKIGIKAIVVRGKSLKNFEKLINGEAFQGTVIE